MRADERSLGIMTRCQGSHFVDKGYYKKLTLYGRKHGMRVFVFSPRQVNFSSRTVRGFEYRNGSWQPNTFPLPALIYDRCFVGPSYRHYKPFVEKLQNDRNITFLGHGLSGKWQVHQMLTQSPQLASLLPPTEILSLATVNDMLQQYGAVVIKPMAGTHGIGVVRIKETKSGYEATGRNRENQPFRRLIRDSAGLKTFIASFTSGRKFLVQPYLKLHTPDGTPFDVRVLVQKTGRVIGRQPARRSAWATSEVSPPTCTEAVKHSRSPLSYLVISSLPSTPKSRRPSIRWQKNCHAFWRSATADWWSWESMSGLIHPETSGLSKSTAGPAGLSFA